MPSGVPGGPGIAPPPFGAPPSGAPRRRRTGLWIGLGLALVLLIGAGVTLAVLAPWKSDGDDKGKDGDKTAEPESTAVQGDVDGDGLGDAIYYFARDYSDITEVTAISDGSAFELTEVAIEASSQPDLLFFDWDGDGVTDQLAWDFVSSGKQLTLSSSDDAFPGDQRFTLTLSTLSEYGNLELDVVPGDYDGDGDLDLAVAGQNDKNVDISVLLNEGDGTFSEPALWLSVPNAIMDVTQIWGGDFDGDGTADIWAQLPADRLTNEDYTSYYSGDRGYALLKSTGDAFDYGQITETDVYQETFLVGDVTGDGTTSIVGVDANGYEEELTVTVFDVSKGTLEEIAGFTGTADIGDRQLESAALTDVDGDGKADIAFAVKGYEDREFTGIQVMKSTGAVFDAATMWAETPVCDDDRCGIEFVGDLRYYN
ncbi:hypothetical protein GCM10025786_12550 [Nocardioides caeni]